MRGPIFPFLFSKPKIQNKISRELFVQITDRFTFEFLVSRFSKLDLMLICFDIIFFTFLKLLQLYSGLYRKCTRVFIELYFYILVYLVLHISLYCTSSLMYLILHF